MKKRKNTVVLEEEPISALARAPRGFEDEDEDEPGTAQAAPPEMSSRIAIFSLLFPSPLPLSRTQYSPLFLKFNLFLSLNIYRYSGFLSSFFSFQLFCWCCDRGNFVSQ